MAYLHLLGTGAALSEPHRTTTMLAVSDEDSLILFDCGGDVVQRCFAAGLDLDLLSAVILTHEHPDHISGFPLFMEKIWLAGRRRSIPFYGPAEGLDQARRCFDTFDTSRWTGLPEADWHPVEELVIDDANWHITAKPVVHSVPTLGFRIVSKKSGGIVGYSCDTEPCANVISLGRDADILVHEATGDFPGHSTANQAAETAKDAHAKRLLLVHLPPDISDEGLNSARDIFPETEWGEELGRYAF